MGKVFDALKKAEEERKAGRIVVPQASPVPPAPAGEALPPVSGEPRIGHEGPWIGARLEAMTKACFDSQDYAEGRRAFMEKRKPKFQGR